MRLFLRLLLLVPAATGVVLGGSSMVSRQQTDFTVFEGARLIDGTGRPARTNTVIEVQGDRVTAIGTVDKRAYPSSIHVINVTGRTIMPSIINAHGHLGLVLNGQVNPNAYTSDNIEKELIQYEQYGVTSVLSLGLNKDLIYRLRDEQRSGEFPGASVFTAGRGIGVEGGAPPVPVGPDQIYRPHTADEARAAVREMAEHHPDIIKIWVNDFYGKYPKMKPEIYRAVIDEAHQQHLRVAAHVFYLADAKALVADGVDVLAHSIRDAAVDPELISAMKARRVIYIPTLTVDESAFIFAEDPSLMQDAFFKDATGPDVVKQFESALYGQKVEADPNLPRIKAALAMGMENLKTLHDAGVHIAFGTDSGANPARIPGWAEHHELELMVRAGLTPMQAIVAATGGSASVLGSDDRGILTPGKRADFLVLAANPVDDIRNTRRLVSIWHDGKEIVPRVPAVQ